MADQRAANEAEIGARIARFEQAVSRQGHRGRDLAVRAAALFALAIRTLKEPGYAPVGFASSTAEREAFRADPERFDAIVTDERMGGLPDRSLSGKCVGSEAQSRSFWSMATSAAR